MKSTVYNDCHETMLIVANIININLMTLKYQWDDQHDDQHENQHNDQNDQYLDISSRKVIVWFSFGAHS